MQPSSVTHIRTSAEARAIPNVGLFTRLMLMMAPSLKYGALRVTLPDGRAFRFQGSMPGVEADIAVKNERVARRLLMGGNLSFGESYLDGDWESDDLAALTYWACMNEGLDETLKGKGIFRALRRLLFAAQENSKTGSRKNIAYHYDLGNAFYAEWLDPSMTYSSAIFARPDMTLEAAQEEKYRALAEKLDVKPGQSVLEIGCGWGGFSRYLAQRHDCYVHAITISQAQHDYAAQEIKRLGLDNKIRLELRDYRDVTEQYDRIASIEMFEAVGEKYWPTFFAKLRSALKPSGRAALQIITIADRYFEDYRGSMDFIQKYIFPGGMLPSPQKLRELSRDADLVYERDESIGLHYAETLKRWHKQFMDAWPRLERMGYDERFKRMWRYYLAYCEGGFRAQTIDVAQIALRRDG